MRKKLVSLATAFALFSVGTFLGSIASSPRSAHAATQFKAFSPDRESVENTVNVRPKDERGGLGDYLVGTSPLRNRPGGRLIGNEKHQCFDIKGTENSFEILCNVTFWIQGRGKIQGAGSFKVVFTGRNEPPAPAAIALVGGTGEFRDARGTVQLRFKRHGIAFVFRVID